MSDQYGSFDNPYGGKPPFEGQEPPVPPTPYAVPQQPQAPQQPPAQPQGWGQPPPAYGQVHPGQQPPAYRPYYPKPDADSRPGTVVGAAVMTIVGSVIALVISAFMVPAGIADYNDPTSTDKGVTLAMLIWFGACGVLSLAAIPLGIMLLFRSNIARVLLTVVGSLAALLSLFVVLYPALIISALVMLYVGRAGAWFAGRRSADPWQQPPPTPGANPPTHQRF